MQDFKLGLGTLMTTNQMLGASMSGMLKKPLSPPKYEYHRDIRKLDIFGHNDVDVNFGHVPKYKIKYLLDKLMILGGSIFSSEMEIIYKYIRIHQIKVLYYFPPDVAELLQHYLMLLHLNDSDMTDTYTQAYNLFLEIKRMDKFDSFKHYTSIELKYMSGLLPWSRHAI